MMAVPAVTAVASAGSRRRTSGQRGVRRVLLHSHGYATMPAPGPPEEVAVCPPLARSSVRRRRGRDHARRACREKRATFFRAPI